MICRIQELTGEKRDEILSFCQRSCLGVKAAGPLLSYGTGYPFLEAWEQHCGDTLTAVITRFYGSTVICTLPESSPDGVQELTSFQDITGSGAVMLDSTLFGVPPSGCMMKLERGRDCKAVPTTDAVTFAEDRNFREFYAHLVSNNPGYLPAAFDDWYVDFSHRIRHGTAHSVLLYADGQPCATIAALSVTDHAVFLGAVSTDPAYCGRHYAFTLLNFITNQYADRTIFLCCKADKRAFYEKAGKKCDGLFSEKTGGRSVFK